MNPSDLRYMHNGKPCAPLTHRDKLVLAPIDIRGEDRKKALLLLHGFGSSPAVYREILPMLIPLYDAVLCPLLPGHGESVAAFSIAKASDWLRVAEQHCEALVKDYEHVDVLGLSLGGLLACALSQRFRLHHLYLLAPALVLNLHMPPALLGAKLLHRLGFRYLRNRAGNICNEKHHELAYRQLPLSTVIEILTFVNCFPFEAPRCQTDLFLGRFDRVVNSNAIAERFASLPNVRTHWLEHSAHVLPLDNDRESITECIKQQQSLS